MSNNFVHNVRDLDGLHQAMNKAVQDGHAQIHMVEYDGSSGKITLQRMRPIFDENELDSILHQWYIFLN